MLFPNVFIKFTRLHKLITHICATVAALNIVDNNLDIITNSINEILLSAEEVIGRATRKKTPLVTTETMNLCDKRRELRLKKYTSIKEEDERGHGNELKNNVSNLIKR
ncbi:hypothetical protein DPMN_094138 [Dreissena polymorpha]|uniref:Uncharacterized protein n=1 Tax=Dreissena polymorpha TaxID=45954 RepID=A0A9D4R389_DREPO|nr:hypothetical protein DPMN_094138 [Dreissena polymorpha]